LATLASEVALIRLRADLASVAVPPVAWAIEDWLTRTLQSLGHSGVIRGEGKAGVVQNVAQNPYLRPSEGQTQEQAYGISNLIKQPCRLFSMGCLVAVGKKGSLLYNEGSVNLRGNPDSR
jgi:hypothetical protein